MKKKTIRFFLYLLILLPIGIFVWGWIDMKYFAPIDTETVDRYYDLLSKHAKPVKTLTLSLGTRESDNLEIAMKRLIEMMGLKKYSIDLVWGDQETPPAYVENVNNEYMTITVSRKIKQRREIYSALVHELSHISIWSLEPSLLMTCGIEKSSDKSIFKDTNLEKVVDTSGIFQGQGILTLNGLTDESYFIPGQSFSQVEKTFGYLKPEQFGYLLARFCAEQGISAGSIEPFLEPAGRKYFNLGRYYLERKTGQPWKTAGDATGVYWCPACGHRITVKLSGGPPEIQCPQCSFSIKKKKEWEQQTQLFLDSLSQYQQKLVSEVQKKFSGLLTAGKDLARRQGIQL